MAETTWTTVSVTALPHGYRIKFDDGSIDVPAVALQYEAGNPANTRVVALLPMMRELLTVDDYIAVLNNGAPAPDYEVMFLAPGKE